MPIINSACFIPNGFDWLAVFSNADVEKTNKPTSRVWCTAKNDVRGRKGGRVMEIQTAEEGQVQVM